MESALCHESSFPHSCQDAKPGTKDVSSDRSAHCCQNRFGQNGPALNRREIYAISRFSMSLSTVNCMVATWCVSEFESKYHILIL